MARVVTLSAPTGNGRFPPLSVCARHERELERVAPIYCDVDHGKHDGECDGCEHTDEWQTMLRDGRRPRPGRPPLDPDGTVARTVRLGPAEDETVLRVQAALQSRAADDKYRVTYSEAVRHIIRTSEVRS